MAHRGELKANANEEEGTEFIVLIPIVDADRDGYVSIIKDFFH